MTHRHDVARPHEEVGLAELGGLLLAFIWAVRSAMKKRVTVALELGPLMGQERVLDGQLVQAELLLHRLQELGARLVEPDPHEPVGELEDLADVLDGDVGHAAAARIGHAVHDTGHESSSP